MSERERRIVNLQNTARYAAVSEKTVRRWISAGHVPALRVGTRIIRIDLDDVDAFLDGRAEPEKRPGTTLTPAVREHIRRVVADAPPLTDEQIDTVASILWANA